jgi:hypothetical protein
MGEPGLPLYAGKKTRPVKSVAARLDAKKRKPRPQRDKSGMEAARKRQISGKLARQACQKLIKTCNIK